MNTFPKFWTNAELDILRQNYPNHGSQFCEAITKARFGWSRGHRNIMQKAMKLGIKYVGARRGCFKKGQIPMNAGKKMSAKTKALVAPTCFKPGNLPHNTKPKGQDLSYRTDDRGVRVPMIRLAIGKWIPLSRHTWISYYGEIPAGYIVIFRDGNTENCVIENLDIITRAENARRNHNREKVIADAAALGDQYVISYMSRYHGIKINIEDARATGLIEIWRAEIQLKRIIKQQQR